LIINIPCKPWHSAAVIPSNSEIIANISNLLNSIYIKPTRLPKDKPLIHVGEVGGKGKDASAHNIFWQLRGYTAKVFQSVSLLISCSDEGNEGQAWQDLAEGF